MTFSTGMMVRHSSLGLGKVVAVDRTAVHVFFPDGERREAAKLSLAAAAPFLTAAPSATDERLDGLPAFSLDPATGRFAPDRPRAKAASKTAKAKKK